MNTQCLKQSLVAVLLGATALLAAAEVPPAPPAPPPACTAPEYRQFDFWAGSWVVTSEDGKKQLGESLVDRILENCVLHEHWRGGSGFKGESFNIYDSESQRWMQNWVDQSGGTLRLAGGLQGVAMVLEGQHAKAGAAVAAERISWTPLPDGRVRQLWQTSTDGGKTWVISFDGYYRRKT